MKRSALGLRPTNQVTRWYVLLAGCAAAAVCFSRGVHSLSGVHHASVRSVGWTSYNADQANTHSSPLAQINRTNVQQLKLAWHYDAGSSGGLETNPLVIGRMLFAYTTSLKVVALDATNGKELWTFTPALTGHQPSRGFTFWQQGKEKRLFAYAMNYAYALDPDTGKPITSFGEGGRIDLRKDLNTEYKRNNVALTTPGVVYKDLLILGFRTSEFKPAPKGDIRAYDVRTGKLRWTFHTIPRPGEEGYDTWSVNADKDAGGANNWCGMALDEKRGIVYVPTGSAVTDMYGADRVGNDLYANTLLALDATTGKRIWSFQGVHHDIWDRDFPSPPTLLRVRQNGKAIDAVAQPTKHGFLFVFDRTNGRPLFPITETPFPPSDVPGEVASPTQPTVALPVPFARQKLTKDLLTTRSKEAHDWAEAEFKKLNGGGLFVPFRVNQQTIVFPGFDGGAEWGGSAVSPNGILYINANDVVWTGGLVHTQRGLSPGAATYLKQCSLCHGDDRRGSPPTFPSLVGIEKRLTDTQIADTIHSGKGRMPAFPDITGREMADLLTTLRTGAGLPGHSPQRASSGPAHEPGAKVYAQNCAICHGVHREGEPSNYPALLGVHSRLSDRQILDIIMHGKGRMPAFPRLPAEDRAQLLRFLGPALPSFPPNPSADTRNDSDKKELEGTANAGDAPFRFSGYHRFTAPDGFPAVAPPWGTLSAIDLNTGKYLWRVPLGEYPQLAARGEAPTGTENYGGPIVTAGGLVFIGATVYDKRIRAFDAQTGKVLWSAELPYAGVATPATYSVDGKQYVVIATSGQRNRKGPQGAAYVAFALP
ncbi:MAG: PQQ-binding-like beta-propeller repeat protein [Acidobacteria bacterium]|nr:PQQ-binding-like beta-propeller repeat protein [Acidobacteriota bacterium]